jgi:hypothetical protein
MSEGGRGRVSLGVGVWKSSQKWSVQRSAVRSIAWLNLRQPMAERDYQQHQEKFNRVESDPKNGKCPPTLLPERCDETHDNRESVNAQHNEDAEAERQDKIAVASAQIGQLMADSDSEENPKRKAADADNKRSDA